MTHAIVSTVSSLVYEGNIDSAERALATVADAEGEGVRLLSLDAGGRRTRRALPAGHAAHAAAAVHGLSPLGRTCGPHAHAGGRSSLT